MKDTKRTRPFSDILEAREARWRRRLSLAKQGTVLTVTLNIPGMDKASSFWTTTHGRIADAVETFLAPHLVHAERGISPAGAEAHFVVALPAAELKRRAVVFETFYPAGRLVDADVMGGDGVVVGREFLGLPPRLCFCCNRPAKDCAPFERHSSDEVRRQAAAIAGALPAGSDWKRAFALETALTAQGALIDEAAVSPKPGLVTPESCGAHEDMDFSTFLDSAGALLSCLAECASLGLETALQDPELALARLREAGERGEKAMYEATGGVNTHKGAIFLLGLLCAAVGRLRAKRRAALPNVVARTAAAFVKGIVNRELKGLERLRTAGERAYAICGAEGARGEAERGFPMVCKALECLRFLERETELSFKERAAHALLVIMAENPDTNVIARGGAEALHDVRTAAQSALEAGGMTNLEGRGRVAEMERLLQERNLSPGGSADVLSCAVFLRRLETRRLSLEGR